MATKPGLISAVVAGIVVLAVGVLSVQSAAAESKHARPTISSFTVSPEKLGALGGTVTFSASVGNGATNCTFTSERPVSGLPTTVPCSDGSASVNVALPENQTNKRFTYKFGLLVAGSEGDRTAKAKPVRVDLNAGAADCLTSNYENQYLSGCNFSGLNLTGANFSNSNVEYVNFTGANLTDAVFTGASLQGLIFTDADLTGTEIQNVMYDGFITSGGIIGTPAALPEYTEVIDGYWVSPGAVLTDADLSDSDLEATDLSNINFAGANLSDADLFGAGGSEISFTGANLAGADLANSQLTFDDTFAGADLTNANFTGADVASDVWTNATWSDTTCPDGTKSDDDGGTCVNNLTS